VSFKLVCAREGRVEGLTLSLGKRGSEKGRRTELGKGGCGGKGDVVFSHFWKGCHAVTTVEGGKSEMGELTKKGGREGVARGGGKNAAPLSMYIFLGKLITGRRGALTYTNVRKKGREEDRRGSGHPSG